MSAGFGSGDETEPLLPREPTSLRRAKALASAGNLAGAFELTERAAFAGEEGAWTSYGNLFAKGVGCTKSKTDAAQCYRRASRCGDMKGTGLLAMCMLTGSGMKPEREEGLRILLDMAGRGELTAIRNCAWVFRYGEKFGVARDDAAAKRWMKEEHTVRAARRSALKRVGNSLPRLQRDTLNASSSGKLAGGSYGAGFHLLDNSSTSSLFAPLRPEEMSSADSQTRAAQHVPSSSSPADVPAPSQPPLSIERFRPRSAPKEASAQEVQSPSPQHGNLTGHASSAHQLFRESVSDGREHFANSRRMENAATSLSEGSLQSSPAASKESAASGKQRRLSSQQVNALESKPSSLSRRQSMATLMNPLNSMNQQLRSQQPQLSLPEGAELSSVPPSMNNSNEPEERQQLFQGDDHVQTLGMQAELDREQLQEKSRQARAEQPGTAVYGSAPLPANRRGNSKATQQKLSYAERFVIQCDVRHVGIPLGCTAVTAMWRATALSYKASTGVDFPMGGFPYFEHVVEYGMQHTWYCLWFFTAFLYSIFLSIYAYRSTKFPLLLLQDFEDPILTNFFAAIAIVAGVLTITVPPPVANHSAIEAMFFFLLAYKAFLSVGFWYTDWLFSTGHNSLRRTSPIFFMAVINFFILSTIAAVLAYVELAVFMFLLGSVMWLIVFTTSFSFIAKTYEHGVDKPSPTLFCFLAPYVLQECARQTYTHKLGSIQTNEIA